MQVCALDCFSSAYFLLRNLRQCSLSKTRTHH
jgi:hypothetical protein